MSNRIAQPLVLVVDNEAIVLDLARCILETEGFKVIDSSRADDGHGIVNAGPAIDLLLRVCQIDYSSPRALVVANGIGIGVAAEDLAVVGEFNQLVERMSAPLAYAG